MHAAQFSRGKTWQGRRQTRDGDYVGEETQREEKKDNTSVQGQIRGGSTRGEQHACVCEEKGEQTAE